MPLSAPPPFQVISELGDDGHTIISTATGDVKMAAGHLAQLTPVFAKAAENFLKTEVSWALVVQLAAHLGPQRWLPGPHLQAWIGREGARRDGPPELKARTNAGAPEPRDYQVTGARMIAATGSGMLADDAGTGKTLTALLGLMECVERGRLTAGMPMLVICPNSVMDAWRDA